MEQVAHALRTRVGVGVLKREVGSDMGGLTGRAHEHRLPAWQAPGPDPGSLEVHFEEFA